VNQLYPSRPGAINGVSCPSTAFCVAVGTTSSISGTGYIATSTDGGTTWTSEIAPSGVGSFSGVSCASTSDCVAVGTTVFDAGVGVVATTTDGGTTLDEPDRPERREPIERCFVPVHVNLRRRG
jgi:photosystem II stability/assembly factor-like uncharacterized protein